MSIVYTDNRNYKAIADAIRAQLGTEQQYTPESMAAAIGSIKGGDAPEESILKISAVGTGLASVSPSVAGKMQGLRLYGRSWQNGTPSPENPVPIEGAGEDGSIGINVQNENFIPYAQNTKTLNGITFEPSSDGKITLTGDVDIQSAFSDYYIFGGTSDAGNYVFIPQNFIVSMEYFGKTSPSSSVFPIFRDKNIGSVAGIESINARLKTTSLYLYGIALRVDKSVPFVSGGTVRLWSNYPKQAEFVPYSTPQQLHVSSPDGLLGIPVDSGGNWTDENGQQWVSDVVDFEVGTKTQNFYTLLEPSLVKVKDLAATTQYSFSLPSQFQAEAPPVAICNKLTSAYNNEDNPHFYAIRGTLVAFIPIDTSITDFVNGLEIIYKLSNPITTPLDAETIAAYKDLQSYDGTTNVLAQDAGIEAVVLGNTNDFTKHYEDIEDNLVSGENLTIYKNDRILTVRDVFFQNTHVQSVVLPKVETLKSSIFYNCTSLTNLVIPNCVFIGANAIRRCSKLKFLSFRGGSIGLYALQENYSLIALCVTGNTVCTIQGAALDNTPIASGTGYIYVPDDLVEKYKVATNWAVYANQIKGLSEIPDDVKAWLDEQEEII